MIFQCGDLERVLRTPELMPDALEIQEGTSMEARNFAATEVACPLSRRRRASDILTWNGYKTGRRRFGMCRRLNRPRKAWVNTKSHGAGEMLSDSMRSVSAFWSHGAFLCVFAPLRETFFSGEPIRSPKYLLGFPQRRKDAKESIRTDFVSTVAKLILIPPNQEVRDSSRRSARLPAAVEKSLDPAGTSACATSTRPDRVKLFLRSSEGLAVNAKRELQRLLTERRT